MLLNIFKNHDRDSAKSRTGENGHGKRSCQHITKACGNGREPLSAFMASFFQARCNDSDVQEPQMIPDHCNSRSLVSCNNIP